MAYPSISFGYNGTPSWQRYGGGHKRIEFVQFGPGGLTITLSESGDKSSRETMVTLEPKDVARLWGFLKDLQWEVK